ncbi:membrane protein insertion efficiency factor YidD [Patescibacteria group bacterium]|nr:membrane protein insertion efficiency factor YidD [Patescibacteria group bacterium]
MKYILLFLIRIYQKTLSYDHGYMGKLFPNNRPCKFTPSCSEYGYQAIDKYGAFKGTKMAVQRVIRCTPSAQPGQYDPVP